MTDDSSDVSRRTLLRASAATITVSTVGVGNASAGREQAVDLPFDDRCPEATLHPSMAHCEGATTAACADDHPATVELRAAVRETLERRYPDAGALAEAGYRPYFDALDVVDEDGWSHWLNPEYIGDDRILDPDRPESVLVDNDSWRSIGAMFVATRNGEPVVPPAVYRADDDGFRGPITDANDPIDLEAAGPNHGDGHDGQHDDSHDGRADGAASDGRADEARDAEGAAGERCSPWHSHAGLPGRFAWWFYRQAYGGDLTDGEKRLPCRTPCMLHVWTIDHPDGVYAHDAPPAAYRDLEPAEDPDLDTDAVPGEDALAWETVPDYLTPDRLPEEFSLFDW
ncbi:hypothetical protein [Halopiger goleimassiliensis]|uniref:hypothetical protein n=1 Tax=Halopiger goleimassiliensis TaxID=1293048 RepID=UPI000677600E|nr:hypothetical protein [Halopiger goleimassiliensis]